MFIFNANSADLPDENIPFILNGIIKSVKSNYLIQLDKPAKSSCDGSVVKTSELRGFKLGKVNGMTTMNLIDNLDLKSYVGKNVSITAIIQCPMSGTQILVDPQSIKLK